MIVRCWPCLALLVALAAPARGAPVRIRMAAVAPEGTTWARQVRALSREIESRTSGRVELKWYLGGIAGDEQEEIARIRRGQLDGAAGALFCERLAPSLRVTRIAGLFQNRDESHYVLNRLRPTYEPEFLKSGFVALGVGGFGNDLVFTREPVRTFDELRRQRLWLWNLDEVNLTLLTRMGLKPLALPINEAAPAYDDQRIDGFVAVPTGALGYQWSTRARYWIDLSVGFLPACIVIANRAFDALPFADQQVLRDAAAKFTARFEEASRAADEQLLGGLFERQGLHKLPASAALRVDFFEAAQRARQHLPESLIPARLLSQVFGWIADYRAEHSN